MSHCAAEWSAVDAGLRQGAVHEAAGLIALLDQGGLVRIVRLADNSIQATRRWAPAPLLLLSAPSGWVAMLPESVRLLDLTLHEWLVVPIPEIVAVAHAGSRPFFLGRDGCVWGLSSSNEAVCMHGALASEVADGGPLNLAVCGQHCVVLRATAVAVAPLPAQADVDSGTPGSSSVLPWNVCALDSPASCIAVVDSGHVVVGGDGVVTVLAVEPSGRLHVRHSFAAGCGGLMAATAVCVSRSALDPVSFVAATHDGSLFCCELTRSDLTPENAVVVRALPHDAVAVFGEAGSGVDGAAAVLRVLTPVGVHAFNAADLAHLAVAGTAAAEGSEHDAGASDDADAAALAALVARTVLAESEAVVVRELRAAERTAENGKRQPLCALTVALDTAELEQCREAMDVFTEARLVGDLKPVTRLIPLPATGSLASVQAIAERVFDRRLAVAFQLPSGKVVELRPSTLRVFEALDDEDKLLVCRPLYPGVSLADSAPKAAGSTSVASLDASPIRRGGATPEPSRTLAAREVTVGRSLTPGVGSKAITKTDESALIGRLHDRSLAQKATNLARLERSHYPTASAPKVTTAALAKTIERLAGKEATKRRELAIAKARAECIQNGSIVEPSMFNKKTDEDESERVKRLYDEGLARQASKLKSLNNQYGFKPPPPKVVLKTKEEWDAWQAKMARDTRQVFRLPPDQMYYGKPSPRDRGHF